MEEAAVALAFGRDDLHQKAERLRLGFRDLSVVAKPLPRVKRSN